MTVFKTFLKILYACRIPILTYTIILIIFGGINMQTSDNPTNSCQVFICHLGISPYIYLVHLHTFLDPVYGLY